MIATSEVLLFAFLFFSSFIFIGSCIFCCIFVYQVNKKVKQLTILDKKFTSYLKARGKLNRTKHMYIVILHLNLFFAVKNCILSIQNFTTRKRTSEKWHRMQENHHVRYVKKSEKKDFEVICENEIDCLNQNDEHSITFRKSRFLMQMNIFFNCQYALLLIISPRWWKSNFPNKMNFHPSILNTLQIMPLNTETGLSSNHKKKLWWSKSLFYFPNFQRIVMTSGPGSSSPPRISTTVSPSSSILSKSEKNVLLFRHTVN